MNETPKHEAWLELRRPGFELRLLYPALTPGGQPVELAEEEVERLGLYRVHLSARGEVYVEVARLAGLRPPEEYGGHREYLERRFGAGSVSELTETSLAGSPAWSYAFRGGEIERAVRSLQVGPDTYRVIYDPRSPLNHEIVSTVSVEGQRGAHEA